MRLGGEAPNMALERTRRPLDLLDVSRCLLSGRLQTKRPAKRAARVSSENDYSGDSNPPENCARLPRFAACSRSSRRRASRLASRFQLLRWIDDSGAAAEHGVGLVSGHRHAGALLVLVEAPTKIVEIGTV